MISSRVDAVGGELDEELLRARERQSAVEHGDVLLRDRIDVVSLGDREHFCGGVSPLCHIVGQLFADQSAIDVADVAEQVDRRMRRDRVAPVVDIDHLHVLARIALQPAQTLDRVVNGNVAHPDGLALCDVVHAAALIENDLAFGQAEGREMRAYRTEHPARGDEKFAAPVAISFDRVDIALRDRVVVRKDRAVKVTKKCLVFHMFYSNTRTGESQLFEPCALSFAKHLTSSLAFYIIDL